MKIRCPNEACRFRRAAKQSRLHRSHSCLEAALDRSLRLPLPRPPLLLKGTTRRCLRLLAHLPLRLHMDAQQRLAHRASVR